MRQGNFYFELTLEGPAYLVHRGVSQGGRKLTPSRRKDFWHKHQVYVPDFPGVTKTEGEDGVVVFKITPPAVAEMRRRSLVIVSCPQRPCVWTPRRILRSAERVGTLPPPEPRTSGGERRRGILAF